MHADHQNTKSNHCTRRLLIFRDHSSIDMQGATLCPAFHTFGLSVWAQSLLDYVFVTVTIPICILCKLAVISYSKQSKGHNKKGRSCFPVLRHISSVDAKRRDRCPCNLSNNNLRRHQSLQPVVLPSEIMTSDDYCPHGSY